MVKHICLDQGISGIVYRSQKPICYTLAFFLSLGNAHQTKRHLCTDSRNDSEENGLPIFGNLILRKAIPRTGSSKKRQSITCTVIVLFDRHN